MTTLPQSPPERDFDAVVFDYHHTLVGADPAREWLGRARADLDTVGGPPPRAADERSRATDADLEATLARIWHLAAEIDPATERDLSPAAHAEVFDRTLIAHGLDQPADGALRRALYARHAEQWRPYAETVAVLTALQQAGIRVAVVSNAGYDVGAALGRLGLAALVDVVVTSYQEGIVKPDPRIFVLAAQRLGVAPARMLAVGDNPRDDVGAARAGMTCLILPRGAGPGTSSLTDDGLLWPVLRLCGMSHE